MSLSKRAQDAMANAVADKKAAEEVIGALGTQAAAVSEIADPSSALSEDVATKINEVIQALKAAGMME